MLKSNDITKTSTQPRIEGFVQDQAFPAQEPGQIQFR
jgi:hypothetical protein